MRLARISMMLFFGILMVGIILVSAEVWTGEETDLTPAGTAYEINRGGNGTLIISEYEGMKVRRIVPESDQVFIYEVGKEVSDAKPDVDGNLWFTDYGQTFSMIDISANKQYSWTLDGAQWLSGIAFDDEGHVWISDDFGNDLYRFNPQNTEVCSYNTGVPSQYILYENGYTWTTSWKENGIFQLDTATNHVNKWVIPGENPTPYGMAFDGDGNLWWADTGNSALMMLDPQIDQVRTYPLPYGTEPVMVESTLAGILYTEFIYGTVGILDPAAAGFSQVTQTPDSSTVSPDCANLGEGTEFILSVTTEDLVWTTGTITPTEQESGWTIYQLPEGSTPYGIAALFNLIWVADQGRDKLLRIDPKIELNPKTDYFIFLPVTPYK